MPNRPKNSSAAAGGRLVDELRRLVVGRGRGERLRRVDYAFAIGGADEARRGGGGRGLDIRKYKEKRDARGAIKLTLKSYGVRTTP